MLKGEQVVRESIKHLCHLDGVDLPDEPIKLSPRKLLFGNGPSIGLPLQSSIEDLVSRLEPLVKSISVKTISEEPDLEVLVSYNFVNNPNGSSSVKVNLN